MKQKPAKAIKKLNIISVPTEIPTERIRSVYNAALGNKLNFNSGLNNAH
jgi:hypothetical protein